MGRRIALMAHRFRHTRLWTSAGIATAVVAFNMSWSYVLHPDVGNMFAGLGVLAIVISIAVVGGVVLLFGDSGVFRPRTCAFLLSTIAAAALGYSLAGECGILGPEFPRGLWLVAIFAFGAPMLVFAAVLYGSRKSGVDGLGTCHQCGYDCGPTASQRCPECGSETGL